MAVTAQYLYMYSKTRRLFIVEELFSPEFITVMRRPVKSGWSECSDMVAYSAIQYKIHCNILIFAQSLIRTGSEQVSKFKNALQKYKRLWHRGQILFVLVLSLHSLSYRSWQCPSVSDTNCSKSLFWWEWDHRSKTLLLGWALTDYTTLKWPPCAWWDRMYLTLTEQFCFKNLFTVNCIDRLYIYNGCFVF